MAKKKTQTKERLNITLSKSARQRMEKLRDRMDAESLAEVIRRALAISDCLLSELDSGGKLFVRNDDSEKELVLY